MESFVVVDLGFGDSGKGSVVDALARRHPNAIVVRHNGGCQAAHHVVTDNGRTHCFAQIGSGHFAGATTHLSKHMLFNPNNFWNEWCHLGREPIVTIDPRAMVITPLHRQWNRAQEMARGENRHGSCGQGIGATVEASLLWPETVIRVHDLHDTRLVVDKMQAYLVAMDLRWSDTELMAWAAGAQQICFHLAQTYDEDLDTRRPIIFEGAQGVLLDEDHGFQPHTTWSKTTDLNARSLAKDLGLDPYGIGVCRTYMTRHGAGPFPTEDELVTATRHEAHNQTGQFQGAWRAGFLDIPLLKYAISCCERIDALAITHVDRVPVDGWEVCDRYFLNCCGPQSAIDPMKITEYEPGYVRVPRVGYPQVVARMLERPLMVTSSGPRSSDKTWLT